MSSQVIQGKKCAMVRILKRKEISSVTYPNLGRNGAHQHSTLFKEGDIIPQEVASRLSLESSPVKGEWYPHTIIWCEKQISCWRYVTQQ